MNAKTLSVALATLALMSTGASYAEGISASVGPVGVGLGLGTAVAPTVLNYPAVVGGSNVLEYPAVVGANACNPCARRGLLGGLFGNRTWFDLGGFGLGFKLGGPEPDFYTPAALGANAMIYPSTSVACNGLNGCGVNTLSAVVPATNGGVGLNGTQIGNPWLDLSLWRFGFRAGTVNPDYDMRPAGDAY